MPKHLVVTFASVVLLTSAAYAAEPEPRTAGAKRVTSDVADRQHDPTDSDLPRVAKNQSRPLPTRAAVPANDIERLQQDTGDGGDGWGDGACNCERKCEAPYTSCKLSQSLGDKCKIVTGQPCTSYCTADCT